jgi:hypothetical protein
MKTYYEVVYNCHSLKAYLQIVGLQEKREEIENKLRKICKLLPLPQIYCSLYYRRDHTFENCRTCIKCFNEGHDAKDCGQESQKKEKRFSEVSLQTQKNRVER